MKTHSVRRVVKQISHSYVFFMCTSTDLHAGDTLFCNPRKLSFLSRFKNRHMVFLAVDFIGERAERLHDSKG